MLFTSCPESRDISAAYLEVGRAQLDLRYSLAQHSTVKLVMETQISAVEKQHNTADGKANRHSSF